MAACLLAVLCKEFARQEGERGNEVTTYRTYKAQYTLLHHGAVLETASTRKEAEAWRAKMQQLFAGPTEFDIKAEKLQEIVR